MTEVLISERTRPSGAIILKTESVKMPRTMAQIFKYDGAFKHIVRRAMEPPSARNVTGSRMNLLKDDGGI